MRVDSGWAARLLRPAVLLAVAWSPELAAAQSEIIEEVVVTGTRRAGLSPTETLSPVDMISGERLDRQASFDLTESLSKVSPALNTQRFPIADGTALVRPVTLRNLSPDHTLVLIDGTRRHRSALVNLQLAPLGTVNQGAQAVDWAAFPAAAIERVEILRDGASVQYGLGLAPTWTTTPCPTSSTAPRCWIHPRRWVHRAPCRWMPTATSCRTRHRRPW